jgi:hypothetical protein
MQVIAATVNRTDKTWTAKEHRGRCMEHTLHLAAGDFITVISPPGDASKIAGKKRGRSDSDESDDESGDEFDSDNDEAEDQDDFNLDFNPGDILSKALAFIRSVSVSMIMFQSDVDLRNQIRSSPQARKFFEKLCEEEGLPKLKLLNWVRTRWASMYDLLERLLKLRLVR